jgi:hypothetical protein
MQTIQPVKRGGRRRGAGRPKGSGRYDEPTVPIRVPAGTVAVALSMMERHRQGKKAANSAGGDEISQKPKGCVYLWLSVTQLAPDGNRP